MTARLTLWKLGRKESVAQSRSSLQAVEDNHASTIQSLVNQVAGDYYGVLAAKQLVAVAEAGVESAQAHFEQVKARVALGATAEVDIFTTADDLAQAELDRIDARSTLRLNFAQLKNSMGQAPDSSFDLSEEPLPAENPLPSLQEALPIGLKNRPEVLAAQASLAASRYALAQAEINRGPIPQITSEYTQSYAQWKTYEASSNLLLSLSWPLFDGYATKAAAEAAQANVVSSEAGLQQQINQVGLEVENALIEAQRSRERLEGTAKSVKAAAARLGAAEGKYQQGVGILLDVIDARKSVTEAQASQVQARYDYQTALVSLQRALGTLAIPEMQQ